MHFTDGTKYQYSHPYNVSPTPSIDSVRLVTDGVEGSGKNNYYPPPSSVHPAALERRDRVGGEE